MSSRRPDEHAAELDSTHRHSTLPCSTLSKRCINTWADMATSRGMVYTIFRAVAASFVLFALKTIFNLFLGPGGGGGPVGGSGLTVY